MVIQRIQTLCLILGIGLMVAFFFVPFGYEKLVDETTGALSLTPLRAIDILGFIIPTAVAILLMALGIFMYRNLPTQKLFVILTILITLAEAVMVVYVIVSGSVDTDPVVKSTTTWGGGGLMLIAALIAEIMAVRGITHDQNLLKSYNRLR